MNLNARLPHPASRLVRSAVRCGLLLGSLALAACNDANTASASPGDSTPAPVTGVPSPGTAKAARVEIVQTGLLFTARGQQRQLGARVFDAAGAAIDAPVRWVSSDPANISVAASGLAAAERATGSTQITAVVDGLRSPPLMAVVTTVAAGAVLVGDEQIVRAPRETDPDAAPSLDNTYTVVLRGIALPAVDSLMVGTGSAPVAGRVVAARTVEGGVEVTLKMAPLAVLFPGLEINQRFDLTQLPAIIPEGVAASYVVRQEGNRYTFTPRAAGAAVAKSGAGPEGSRQLFKGCEGSVNGVGLGDGAAPPFVFEPQPVFDFTIAPALDVLYTEARGLERFVVTAEPTFVIDGTVKATAAFEGKVSCQAELLLFTVPVGGALSVVISGLVPVGVGFEVGGKVTVAQLKLGFNSRTAAKAALGLDCQGPCRLVNELGEFVNTNTPTIDVPGLDDFRVKPEITAFGFVEAATGNRFFRSLQFKAFQVKAGPKLEGEFAPPATQIAAADFKSSYKLSLVLNAGFGDDIEQVLNILGVVKVGDEVLEKGIDLAGSPTGVLTVDRERFEPGHTVNFQLKLDPAAVAFLGRYNVGEIVLVRTANGQREVARVPAASGQTAFDFAFIAPDAGQSSEFTAFAVTSLLPVDVLSLELDTARAGNAPPVAVDDRATVAQSSGGETIPVLANDSDANGDALTVSAVTQPAQGSVTIENEGGSVRYRPRAGFSGTETFRYTIVDGKGGSDEGLVTVEVRSGPATVRVEAAGVASRADATSCPKVRNGVCARPAPLISEQRFYNESTGFPASDRTSARSSDEFEGKSVNVETEGRFSIGGGDAARQFDLHCDATGNGTGNGGNDNVAYGGSSSSGNSVSFSVEGEQAALRYEISVTSVASGPASPSTGGRATARVFGGIRDVYEVRHDSIDGRRVVGETSGVLGQGGYTVEVSCTGLVADEGGATTSTANLRLTLSP